MNIIKKQQNFKILFIISSIVVAIFALMYFFKLASGGVSENLYITDFNNLEKMSGVSDNIFVGKVTKYLGDSKKNTSKRTPEYEDIIATFDVEVILNIKGKASKKVKIVQGIDGLRMRKGVLEEGKTYIFSTADMGNNKYAIQMHKNTRIELTKEDLKDLNKSKKVLEFKKAYVNEITFDSMIEFKNAFKKLPKSEKEKLKKEVLKSEFGGEVRK